MKKYRLWVGLMPDIDPIIKQNSIMRETSDDDTVLTGVKEKELVVRWRTRVDYGVMQRRLEVCAMTSSTAFHPHLLNTLIPFRTQVPAYRCLCRAPPNAKCP